MIGKIKELYRKLRNLNEIDDLNKRLKQTDENHKNLIRAYVHETRATSNSLIGFLDLSSMEDISNKEKEEYIKIINSSAEKIVNDLEILSMMNMTKEALRKKSKIINLKDLLVRDVNYGVLDYLNKHNISIEITDKSPEIYACPGAFQFIFGTLGGNSLKWAPDGTIIKKHLDVLDDTLLIQMENVYFEKPNSYRHGLNEGVGIPISKKLIETMGGKFYEYSKPRIKFGSKNSKDTFGSKNSKDTSGSKNSKDTFTHIYGVGMEFPIKEFSRLEEIVR